MDMDPSGSLFGLDYEMTTLGTTGGAEQLMGGGGGGTGELVKQEEKDEGGDELDQDAESGYEGGNERDGGGELVGGGSVVITPGLMLIKTARYRFQDEWLSDPDLKKFVERVPGDESKAFCKYCMLVLSARRSTLTTHMASTKHGEMYASAGDTFADGEGIFKKPLHPVPKHCRPHCSTVLKAIGDNQFTQYELLRIVKSATAKLDD